VSATSENPENTLGPNGAKQLVPWLRTTNRSDYLVILCDPRKNSLELHQTAKMLPKDILSRLIVINADSPADNRKWLKKDSITTDLQVYSDEKMEWMRAYSALGDTRWSMTMFIIAGERVQKLAREVEGVSATRVIRNAVKSMGATRI
jgi:hypothetical protein